MSDEKKVKFLTKSVKFGTKTVTLYSIDGNTWSTRKDELRQVMERHESERVTFGELRGQMSGNKLIAPKNKNQKFRPRAVPPPQPDPSAGNKGDGKRPMLTKIDGKLSQKSGPPPKRHIAPLSDFKAPLKGKELIAAKKAEAAAAKAAAKVQVAAKAKPAPAAPKKRASGKPSQKPSKGKGKKKAVA